MPRGSRSSGSSSRSSRPRPSPPSKPQNLPAAQPPAAVAAPGHQPQQPGLFAQMASTAAGVAVGSTVGHVAGEAITGLFTGGGKQEQPAQQQQQQPTQQQNACGYEMKQFLECAQNQSDVTLCQGFNEALKQCKSFYNTSPSMQPSF